MKLGINTLASGMNYISTMSMRFLTNLGEGSTLSNPSGPAWEQEREDILQRSEYLAKTILVSPKELLKAMPAVLGKNYGGQWAIYSSCMYTFALANISRIYPDQKEKCLDRMQIAIEVTLSPELRYYDTMSWKEDALDSLSGNKSHLSYISLLAWSISEYKLAGGESSKYDELYIKCCEALNRRMRQSSDLNIPTFANNVIFIPDMVPAIISLYNFSKLYDSRYDSTISLWKQKIKELWIHKPTGLILSKSRYGKKSAPRGSYAALTCSYLSMVDEDFAREQYTYLQQVLVASRKVLNKTITGVKEYLNYSPTFKADPDAGPIFQGLSGSGTVFSLGAATRLGDWKFRHDVLASADIVAATKIGKGDRHYGLADFALVGEAVALGMRTNISR